MNKPRLMGWPMYWLSNTEPPDCMRWVEDLPMPGRAINTLLTIGHPYYANRILFVKLPKRDDLVPCMKKDMHLKVKDFKYVTEIKYDDNNE